jgi:hypothetical protein
MANSTFKRNGVLMAGLSAVCILQFGYIALSNNILDKTDTVDDTIKDIIQNFSFFMATVLVINSLNRRDPSNMAKTIGSISINIFIAVLLMYMSKKNISDDNKKNLKKLAKFGFVYLLVWKIIAPLFDLTKRNGNSNNALNARRSYGMVLMYGLGITQLLFMKLYKTGNPDNPDILNHGDDRPKMATFMKDFGFIFVMFCLLLMAGLTAKDSQNALIT